MGLFAPLQNLYPLLKKSAMCVKILPKGSENIEKSHLSAEKRKKYESGKPW